MKVMKQAVFPGLSMTLLSWQWLIFNLVLTCQSKQFHLHSLFLQFYDFRQKKKKVDLVLEPGMLTPSPDKRWDTHIGIQVDT